MIAGQCFTDRRRIFRSCLRFNGRNGSKSHTSTLISYLYCENVDNETVCFPSTLSQSHKTDQSGRKPKNARAKRAMEKRAPQVHENTKTVLFVTGNKSSQILKLAVADLTSLKRPFCERFSKKNDIHPFEDASCTSPLPVRSKDVSLLILDTSFRVLLLQE